MERTGFDRLLTAAMPQIEEEARKYAHKYWRLHEWRDILQTALLKMLRFADLYDPAKGDILSWASVAIINTIKTALAQSATMPYAEEFTPLVINRTPVGADYNPENQLLLAEIMANLNPETRLYLAGYTYAEIAVLRGISKGSVYNRIDRCAERLNILFGLRKERGRRVRNIVKTRDAPYG